MALNTEDKIIEVAKYFIKKSEEDKKIDPSKRLDPLKLQKILYYAKAWNLVFRDGQKIFLDEFQAWIHGPANLKVWQYFQNFDFSADHPEIGEDIFSNISPEEREILDMVWGVYGKFDGKYLEMLTHREEPWLKARQELDSDTISQNIITDESMKNYYERRLKKASASQEANSQ